MKKTCFILMLIPTVITGCGRTSHSTAIDNPFGFSLAQTDTFRFNSFVDCNMAEVWIGDTFRIFPGKYGEDPLWGNAKDLKYADGMSPDETFHSDTGAFRSPLLPPNVKPGKPGLHGAVWFETVYQDDSDQTGKTLYAIYHNENYPSTLPFDSVTGEGYIDKYWPQGLKGPETAAAVCRIGIMKSVNGGRSWHNNGIFIEDLQPRMILKPHNTSITFAGGVGDPSAVRSGDYIYLFYGEYSYPEKYDSASYDPLKEWKGQCISIARIAITDLDDPSGKGKRWDGKGFNAPWNGTGLPVSSLRVPIGEGGGPTSGLNAAFNWGPSVSWNSWLNCWVMLMARSEGTSWKGNNIYISFNRNRDLGADSCSQQWSKPVLLVQKPGYTLWYPSLQPMNSEKDIKEKNTSLKLGEKARLFMKVNTPTSGEYYSVYTVTFKR